MLIKIPKIKINTSMHATNILQEKIKEEGRTNADLKC